MFKFRVPIIFMHILHINKLFSIFFINKWPSNGLHFYYNEVTLLYILS
jgi:hypothetical protein